MSSLGQPPRLGRQLDDVGLRIALKPSTDTVTSGSSKEATLVHQGKQRLHKDGIEVIPLLEALCELPKLLT